MAAGVVLYAAPYPLDDAAPVKALHKAIKGASFQSERLAFEFSNVALYSKDGMQCG